MYGLYLGSGHAEFLRSNSSAKSFNLALMAVGDLSGQLQILDHDQVLVSLDLL